jgi:hypothetical protein
MILKIFSAKNLEKKFGVFAHNKNWIITLFFSEKHQFFRRKLAKIAENCDHNTSPCFWQMAFMCKCRCLASRSYGENIHYIKLRNFLPCHHHRKNFSNFFFKPGKKNLGKKIVAKFPLILNLLVMAKHFLPQSSNLRQNLGRNK